MEEDSSHLEKIQSVLGNSFPKAIRVNKRLLAIVTLTFALTLGVTFVASWAGDNPIEDAVEEGTESIRKELEKKAEIERTSLEQAGFYIRNNLTVMIWTIGMGIGFGIYPIYQLVMNSSIIGYVGVEFIRQSSGLTVLSVLTPHAVFELTGLILSTTVGLSIGMSSITCLKKRTLKPLKNKGKKIAPIIPSIFILVIIAGFVEAFISPLAGGIAFKLAKIFGSLGVFSVIILWMCGKLTGPDDQ